MVLCKKSENFEILKSDFEKMFLRGLKNKISKMGFEKLKKTQFSRCWCYMVRFIFYKFFHL